MKLFLLFCLALAPGLSIAQENECTSEHREFCPPVLRCWKGVEEVSCSSIHADSTLTTEWLIEPPQAIEPGVPFFMSWKIDFKNSTYGGRHHQPWIPHTNIHAAPAQLESLPPPTDHPFRKDSVSLTGGTGIYNGSMSLTNGKWLIMAHVRIQDINDEDSTKYEITLEVVRAVGQVAPVDDTQAESEGEQYEEFCSRSAIKFKDCNSFTRIWIATVSTLYAIMYLGWVRGFFIAEVDKDGHKSLRIDYTRRRMFRMFLALLFAGVVIWVNDRFLDMWLETNREPSMIVTQKYAELQMPHVLICPFTEAGSIELLSAVYYENIYGLKAEILDLEEGHKVDVTNPADRIHFMRQSCLLYGNHSSHTKSANSTFSTFLFKAIVKDPSTSDGWGSAMAIIASNMDELNSIQTISQNTILLDKGKATYTGLSKSVIVDLNGDMKTDFSFVNSILDNPYAYSKSPKCEDSTSGSTVCEREVVFVINFKSMLTEMGKLKVTLSLFTVCTMMVGVISGSKMLLELLSTLFCEVFGKVAKKPQRIVLIGHPETPLPAYMAKRDQAEHAVTVTDVMHIFKQILTSLKMSGRAEESDEEEDENGCHSPKSHWKKLRRHRKEAVQSMKEEPDPEMGEAEAEENGEPRRQSQKLWLKLRGHTKSVVGRMTGRAASAARQPSSNGAGARATEPSAPSTTPRTPDSSRPSSHTHLAAGWKNWGTLRDSHGRVKLESHQDDVDEVVDLWKNLIMAQGGSASSKRKSAGNRSSAGSIVKAPSSNGSHQPQTGNSGNDVVAVKIDGDVGFFNAGDGHTRERKSTPGPSEPQPLSPSAAPGPAVV